LGDDKHGIEVFYAQEKRIKTRQKKNNLFTSYSFQDYDTGGTLKNHLLLNTLYHIIMTL